MEIVNNVAYNVVREPTRLDNGRADDGPDARYNLVGNFYKAGLDGNASTWWNTEVRIGDEWAGLHPISAFIQGNIGPNRPTDDLPEKSIATYDNDAARLRGERFDYPAAETTSAQQAYRDVLDRAGASHVVDCLGRLQERRDSVDARIIDDVRNGTGRLIESEEEVGGFPTLAAGTPCLDVDADGMPDAFEDSYGLDRLDNTDWDDDKNGDGYLNIEEYFNGSWRPRRAHPPCRPADPGARRRHPPSGFEARRRPILRPP